MVSISDKFGKASDGVGYVDITTVKTDRLAAATTLECFDLSNCDEDAPVYFMTYTKTVDPVTDEVTISNQTGWKALANVSSNTFTNLTLAPGYTDVGNSSGDFVELMPTSQWADDLVDGLLVAHNQDGTLKNNAVVTANITDEAVTPIKQSNPYMFSVYRNAALNSASSLTKINFDTVQYDPNSNFDISTDQYTAPVTGYYSLNAAAGNVAAVNTQNVVAILRNGTNIANTAIRIDSTNSGTVLTVSKLIYLEAGDTAEARFLGGSGSTLAVGEHNLYFTGFLVRQTA